MSAIARSTGLSSRALRGDTRAGRTRRWSWRVPPVHRRLSDVLGHVDEHRTGTSGRREVKRRRDRAGISWADLTRKVVLGDAHRDAGDVALLEGVGADGDRRDLAGDDDERRRVHVGVADRRDDVGGARSARDHGDTGAAGRECVALGHVPGSLLVAHEDVADTRVDQRVVDGQNGAAGQAEDGVDPLLFEALYEGLRS
jgi:hypothetical protein